MFYWRTRISKPNPRQDWHALDCGREEQRGVTFDQDRNAMQQLRNIIFNLETEQAYRNSERTGPVIEEWTTEP